MGVVQKHSVISMQFNIFMENVPEHHDPTPNTISDIPAQAYVYYVLLSAKAVNEI